MTGGGAPVDLELKKAFQELQGKVVATTQQLKVNDAQIDSLQRQIQHSKIVESELSSLSEDTNTYQSVGRMFILNSRSGIMKALSEKRKTNEEKIKTIEGQKSYLQKNMKEAENSLRELIMSKQKR